MFVVLVYVICSGAKLWRKQPCFNLYWWNWCSRSPTWCRFRRWTRCKSVKSKPQPNASWNGWFYGNEGVIAIGITNRPDVLGPTLTLSRLSLLTVKLSWVYRMWKVVSTLKVHMRKVPTLMMWCNDTGSWYNLSYSGCGLASLVNEVALLFAARSNKRKFSYRCLFEKPKIRSLWTWTSPMIMTDKQKSPQRTRAKLVTRLWVT